MTRLAMHQWTTFRWSFEQDLLAYQEAGYDGAGLWLRKVRDFGEERAAELLSECGLSVASLSWIGGFTGADAATAVENLAEAFDVIDLAAELSAGCLSVYPGGRNGHTIRHADRLLRGALDRLLPHAERMGVRLALEPMHPACAGDWTLLTDLSKSLSLVREYETPALCLAVDPYHFPLAAESPVWRELVPHLAVVHLSDHHQSPSLDQRRAPLGEGVAPLDQFLGGLLGAGYDGPIEVRVQGADLSPFDYDRILGESLAVSRGLIAGRPRPEAPLTPTDVCNATS